MLVLNENTCSILEGIINTHNNGKYCIWPGTPFDIASEEGKAILGTVHGAGVAWMLIQRNAEFFGKNIGHVTVFGAVCEGDEYACRACCFGS